MRRPKSSQLAAPADSGPWFPNKAESYGAVVSDATDPSLSQVWKLYLDNQAVFSAAIANLRGAGFVIDDATASDFVHEFVVEHAQDAIKTFRPERGEIEGWLYVVFRRFMLGAFRDRTRRQRLLAEFAAETTLAAHAAPSSEIELGQLRAAIESLDPEQQRALGALLASPSHSVRDVARTMKISRWRATKLMDGALAALSERLEGSIGEKLFARRSERKATSLTK